MSENELIIGNYIFGLWNCRYSILRFCLRFEHPPMPILKQMLQKMIKH